LTVFPVRYIILDELKHNHGEMKSRELGKLAQEEGINDSAMKRAKKKLQAEGYKGEYIGIGKGSQAMILLSGS